MKKNSLLILLILLLTSCVSPNSSEEFTQGKSTFQSGDYKKAFHELLPVAANGNTQAQYAVGYMYYYGYGVAQDKETGIFWMKKAADQRYQPAMIAVRNIQKITRSPAT